MPRVWILGSTRNETNRDLAERWCACGVPAGIVSSRVDLRALLPGDVVLGRIDVRRSVDGIEPGLLTLLAASRIGGVQVLNRPSSILNAHDKLRTARAFAAHGVPHPRTIHVRPGELVDLPPPLVVKPRFGSWGVDVFHCLSRDEVRDALAAISDRPWFRRQGAIVQELVPPLGYDIRVLVAGGEVVGAEQRIAAPGEWRNNISLGGTHWPAAPSREVVELALAAVAAVDGDFFGVDLLPLPAGAVVLEVNAAVEFEDGYSLGGGDLFADIASALGLTRLALPASETALLPAP